MSKPSLSTFPVVFLFFDLSAAMDVLGTLSFFVFCDILFLYRLLCLYGRLKLLCRVAQCSDV